MDPYTAPRFQIDPNRQIKQKLELQRGVGYVNYSAQNITHHDGLSTKPRESFFEKKTAVHRPTYEEKQSAARMVLREPTPMNHAEKRSDSYVNADGLIHQTGFHAHKIVRVPNEWWNNRV